MGNYSTKHKVILGMAAILLLVVGSALGYLVGSARSDASSAGFSEALRGLLPPREGTLAPGRAESQAQKLLTRERHATTCGGCHELRQVPQVRLRCCADARPC